MNVNMDFKTKQPELPPLSNKSPLKNCHSSENGRHHCGIVRSVILILIEDTIVELCVTVYRPKTEKV